MATLSLFKRNNETESDFRINDLMNRLEKSVLNLEKTTLSNDNEEKGPRIYQSGIMDACKIIVNDLLEQHNRPIKNEEIIVELEKKGYTIPPRKQYVYLYSYVSKSGLFEKKKEGWFYK